MSSQIKAPSSFATSEKIKDYLQQRKSKLQALPANRYVQLAEDGTSSLYSHQDSNILSIDTSAMSVEFLISTTRRDRHGDVVVPTGCLKTLADYEKNPRIFFAHRSMDLPIASARNPKTAEFTFWVEDSITSRAFFHGKTQLSNDVFELCVSKDLQAASISFQPHRARFMEEPDQSHLMKEEIDFDHGGLIFDEWSMLEWSVVPIPANPDAVRCWLSSRRGKNADKGLVATLAQQLPKSKLSVSVSPSSLSRKKGMEHNPSENKLDVQAFIFDLQYFPDIDNVYAWLAENHFNPDNVHPGQEADEPFVSIQFPSTHCELHTAKREKIEPGVQAVTCLKSPTPRNPAEGEEDVQLLADATNHMSKFDDKKEDEEHPGEDNITTEHTPEEAENELNNGEEEVQQQQAEEEVAALPPVDKPYGCSLIEQVLQRLYGVRKHLAQKTGPLEHPEVKLHLEQLHCDLDNHSQELVAFAYQNYPDHFVPSDHQHKDGDLPKKEVAMEEEADGETQVGDEFEKEEGDGGNDEVVNGDDNHQDEGDDGEEADVDDKNKKKKPPMKMATVDLSVVSETAEFLEEMASEDNLKKSQKAACQQHRGVLLGLHEKYTKTADASVNQEDAVKSQRLNTALAALSEAHQALKDRFYSLTGQEV